MTDKAKPPWSALELLRASARTSPILQNAVDEVIAFVRDRAPAVPGVVTKEHRALAAIAVHGKVTDRSALQMQTLEEDADLEALSSVTSSIGRELPDDMRRALVTAYSNTLTRIRAALADREHLEDGRKGE